MTDQSQTMASVGRLLLASATVAVLAFAPTPSRAQLAVTCVNCSTLAQEVLGYVRQAEQLVQEVQTATNTLNFYVNAVRNTKNLPNSVYRDVTGDVQRIMSLAQQGSMLRGYANRMIQTLNSPNGYPDALVGDWPQRLLDQNNALGNAMKQAAMVFDRQQQELAADSSRLGALQAEAMSSDGRQKTLQTIAGTNAALGQVVQKQAGTVATGMQAQLTYYAAQADRQMLFDQWDRIMHRGAIQGDCLALRQNGGSASECGN